MYEIIHTFLILLTNAYWETAVPQKVKVKNENGLHRAISLGIVYLKSIYMDNNSILRFGTVKVYFTAEGVDTLCRKIHLYRVANTVQFFYRKYIGCYGTAYAYTKQTTLISEFMVFLSLISHSNGFRFGVGSGYIGLRIMESTEQATYAAQ